MKMSGAELMVRLLERQGIRIIAGIPGGANLPLYDALGQSELIEHVLVRHEQAAGFLAQGLARVTGTPQVCFATSGPGATNLLTALADAKLDSIPLVAVTGQVAQSLIGTDAFQEVDTYGLSIPITKHNYLVRSAAELLEVVPEAFRIAASGRPGPVLIDFPKDVQKEVIDVEAFPAPATRLQGPIAADDAFAAAAALINEAKRPVLYVGGGVVQSGASEAVRALSEHASIPVAMTLMGLGILPTDHPLSLGMLGMHAARYTNYLLEECDLLLAVGVRFDDRATGKVEAFCPGARVVHIDIDPAELGKIRVPHVSIAADAGEALARLAPMIEAPERGAWLERVRELKASAPLMRPGLGDTRTPYGLIDACAEVLQGATIVTDVGQHQMWVAQAYPFTRPGQLLTSGGLGTMGFGLPTAIGAALAQPGALVACFTGDGSLLMNIQELATLADLGARVKIILMNNNSLGLVHQQQELFFGSRIFASDFVSAPNFTQIAAGFGVPAWDLADAADSVEMLIEALAAPGPALIHAPVSVAEQVLPMVAPGAANCEMIGGEEHVYATA
jgi:acetolactate synthase-1/2/3 large subunit